MIFEVSPASCDEGLSFIQTFLSHRDEPHRKFSILADPAKFEGANCLSFAMETLKHFGLLNNVSEDFKSEVRIPLDLFGNLGQNDDSEVRFNAVPETLRRVSLNQILYRSWSRWTADEYFRRRIIDQELIFLFYQELSHQVFLSAGTEDRSLRSSIRKRRQITTLNSDEDGTSELINTTILDRNYSSKMMIAANAFFRSRPQIDLAPFFYGHVLIVKPNAVQLRKSISASMQSGSCPRTPGSPAIRAGEDFK